MGFETVLLSDAIRGINAKPNDVRDAIAEMIKNGAEQATLEDFQNPLKLHQQRRLMPSY